MTRVPSTAITLIFDPLVINVPSVTTSSRSPLKSAVPVGRNRLSAIPCLSKKISKLCFGTTYPSFWVWQVFKANLSHRRRVWGIRKLNANNPCLLYTSDAADEEDSVDLGGRR